MDRTRRARRLRTCLVSPHASRCVAAARQGSCVALRQTGGLVQRRAPRSLVALCAIAIALCAQAAQAPVPLQAARWLPDDRRWPALHTAPNECLAATDDAATASLIAIGRSAFRTPLLLGGQAARNGLSCHACHRNGRDNPDFFIAGLSDAPGTADVTSSRFSSHRGDGVFNPKRIPDLAAPVAAHRVARDDPALASFIRGLIVEEFDGPEPSAATLAGLSAYVRHLRANACAQVAPRAIGAADYLADARAALRAAQAALGTGDDDTARLMIASARSALQAIEERYRAPELRRERDALIDAARALGAIRNAIGEHNRPRTDSGGAASGNADARAETQAPNIAASIDDWIAAMPRWQEPLLRSESKSLFDAARLRAALTLTPEPNNALAPSAPGAADAENRE